MSKPNWDKIREEFEASDITMKDLADKHGVKASTLRSRKNREGWSRDEPKKATQQTKKNVATQRNKKRSVATQKAIEEFNESSDLNERQKQFCLLYLKYFNATKAYKEAYGCSYATANTNGSALLADARIKEELSRLKKAQRSDLYLESLDIKHQWAKQAFADITDFVDFGTEEVTLFDNEGMMVFDEQGEPTKVKRSFIYFKDPEEMDGSLIQEAKMGRDGPVIKLYDKQRAMDRLIEFLIETDVVESDDDGFLAALEAEGEELWPEE